MISKSYQLLNYLNRPHSSFSRQLLGGAGWLGTIVLTRDAAIAGWARSHFIKNDFKQGFRTCAWIARVAIPKTHVWGDHFFDFTEHAKPEMLDRMHAFVERSGRSRSSIVNLTDKLYILSARVHESIQDSSGEPDLVKPYIGSFYETANKVLHRVSTRQTDQAEKTVSDDEREGDFSLAHAKKALEDFANLFPISDWQWYVVSGTLLGIYRDGGFMAHDYDIDVGINNGEVDADVMLNVLDSDPRFVVKKIDHHLAVGRREDGRYEIHRYRTMYKVIHKDGVNIDVFIHYREDDVLWHGSVIHRWDNKVYGLTTYSLAGVPVLGPDNPDEYLEENYGDWKTPVTDFDCTTGTPNLVIAKNFLSVALFIKRLAHFAHHDIHQYEKLRSTLLRSGIVGEENGQLYLKDFL